MDAHAAGVRHQYASKESGMKILYLVVAMLIFSVNATAEESSGDREILKKGSMEVSAIDLLIVPTLCGVRSNKGQATINFSSA